ncbi:MAG: ABC transporter permease subunit [Acetobacteraceae bacterium]|nr:ABC transporter permease subunit [Acetobacteraceae bacterium]
MLSRLLASIRTSLSIAFGATLIGAAFGTSLGFLAAHFRGVVEQAVLALVDFSATIPMLIFALSVLAFFGNSRALMVALLGLHAWERYARIARGLAIAASVQGYAFAVRQLGAGPWRVYLRHVLPNIASTLIVSMTLAFPEVILLEFRPLLPRPRRPAARHLARFHGRLRAGLSHPRAVDPAVPGRRDRAHHPRRLAARRLVA